MQNDELLPCPMCGAEEQITSNDNGPVYCRKCGLRSLSPEHWNTRTAHSGEGRSNGAGEDALRKALRPFANAAKWWKAFDGQHRITTLHQHGDCLEVGHLRAAEVALSAPQGEVERLRETCIDVAAHLAAAISLLEKGGSAAKKAAPSDKMFDQMIRDYKRSLNRARAALAQPKGGDHG